MKLSFKLNYNRKGNIIPKRFDIAFFHLILHLPREVAHLIQHILNENAVPRGGIVYEDVRYSADKLAVLHNGRAQQECGQERTTHFYNF